MSVSCRGLDWSLISGGWGRSQIRFPHLPVHLTEWPQSSDNKYAFPAPTHLSSVNPFRHGVMLWDKQGQRPFVMIARLILIGQLCGLENCHWLTLWMFQTLVVLLVWDHVETMIVICYLSFSPKQIRLQLTRLDRSLNHALKDWPWSLKLITSELYCSLLDKLRWRGFIITQCATHERWSHICWWQFVLKVGKARQCTSK